MQLTVDLNTRSYPILIEAGLLQQPDQWRHFISGSQVVVISNDTVAPLHLASLKKNLHSIGKQVIEIILPDGETYKTFTQLQQILDGMLKARVDRDVTVLSLGGGVIGDLSGLAAALYMRGVRFIQIPTTLLAQVDSSIGGKTAINHELGKNMIGAFYQPDAVLIDTTTLLTLPARELSCGLAEMIKHGAILDPDYFAWLEMHVEALLELDQNLMGQAIARSCAIKAGVVARDEREQGERAFLNFGHTFGHAIEGAMGYGQWLHGEAVAAGMVLACRASEIVFGIALEARMSSLLQRARLPIAPPEISVTQWLHWMQIDKKNKAGAIRFILLKRLGEATLQTIPNDVLQQVLLNSR